MNFKNINGLFACFWNAENTTSAVFILFFYEN